jgi:prepilin-type N-terminal cleavage/methylation domain-containing protein
MKKAFTLVEMLVAMAVSTIIIAATYASYDLVATQYKKNIDVAEMHASGRAVMQMIERDVRMAGFEYRDNDANVTYGSITAPLVIKDSGNKCCDEVAVIYDYYDEESKKAERIRITYSAESHSSNKGDRFRLYKQIDVLGRNNAILAKPIIGSKDLLADFIEDLQLVNFIYDYGLYIIGHASHARWIHNFDPSTKTMKQNFINTNVWVYNPSMVSGPDGLLYILGSHSDSEVLYIVDPATKKMTRIKTGFNIGLPAMAFKSKRTGQESLVTINLTLRIRNEYGKDRQFKKKDYHGGNFKIDKTDKYKRDTFSSKVLVRNMAL